jgi:hypothetical protein
MQSTRHGFAAHWMAREKPVLALFAVAAKEPADTR